MASRPPIPRSLRLLNLGALLLFAAGAGLHVYSWVGMGELRERPPEPGAEPFTGMARFNELWELSRLGTWLVMTAVGLAVIAAAAAIIMARRTTAADDDGPG